MQMNNVKAVIFDMDGVIFDTERVYLNLWDKVFRKHGYKLNSEDYISVMGKGREVVKSTFLSIYGEDLPIDIMYKEKDQLLYSAVERNEVPVKEGAIDLLKYLKKSGIKIALATSAKKERAYKQLEASKLLEVFDCIVTKENVNLLKPNPDIFIKASEILKEKPNNCIVVEDSRAGIEAAYKGNMIPFHVEDLAVADNRITKYTKYLFKDCSQILEFMKSNISR